MSTLLRRYRAERLPLGAARHRGPASSRWPREPAKADAASACCCPTRHSPSCCSPSSGSWTMSPIGARRAPASRARARSRDFSSADCGDRAGACRRNRRPALLPRLTPRWPGLHRRGAVVRPIAIYLLLVASLSTLVLGAPWPDDRRRSPAAGEISRLRVDHRSLSRERHKRVRTTRPRDARDVSRRVRVQAVHDQDSPAAARPALIAVESAGLALTLAILSIRGPV